jgi:hypothetical protein
VNENQVSESLGFWTLSIVRNSKYKTTQRFGNWMFPPSGEGGGETPTLLGYLKTANLNHWIGRWTKSRNPVILSAIHHRQNPSDSKISFAGVKGLDDSVTCLHLYVVL